MFFKKRFYLVLILLVLISYGQMLNMYVWQDDNALMFKMAHIDEKAGYLGPGPFGSGPYKYIATPYIPIHTLFGYNTVAYYTLTLMLYVLTTLIVYKVFSSILGRGGGMVAGFLYSTGYIASDGIIRLFNSVVTSVSVILVSLLTLSYWRYYKTKLIKWYLLSLLLFFLTVELASGRTHYLIAVVTLFELIVIPWSSVKQFLFSIFRIAPFAAIFYVYYLKNADTRSGQVSTLISGLFRGEFYQLYSFISSFANVVLPDWFSSVIYKTFGGFKMSLGFEINILWVFFLILVGLLFYRLFRSYQLGRIIIFSFILILIVWFLLVGSIFSNQLLNLSKYELFRVYLGGILLILVPAIFIVVKDFKRLYLFFILWVLVNLIAYSAYNPAVNYESVNRYLAHSFFAFIGVVAVIYTLSQKTSWQGVFLTTVLIWGFGNLAASVIYQNNIVYTRSNPVRDFYSQFRSHIPNINKGDVFFIDVADVMKPLFENAFSVASMPETTAIAWRYGIDRYDLKLFTDFEGFKDEVAKGKISPDKIHTLFYSHTELFDTSLEMKKLLMTSQEEKIDFSEEILAKTVINQVEETTNYVTGDLLIDLPKPIKSLVPITLTFSISAEVFDFSPPDFPIKSGQHVPVDEIANNKESIKKSFDYKESKYQMRVNSDYKVSSFWTNRSADKIGDFDVQTFWQADRILWKKRNEFVVVDIKEVLKISKIVWINGIGNNTPTKFGIEISVDGLTWRNVKSVNRYHRVDSKEPQIVEFDPQVAKYIKFVVTETLSGDAPAISEMWVVPAVFEDLNLKQVERYLLGPFAYFSNQQIFNEALLLGGKKGLVEVRWLSDKESSWTGINNSRIIELVYDGQVHSYSIDIPASGTRIDKIKLSGFQIPGFVQVYGLSGINKTSIIF